MSLRDAAQKALEPVAYVTGYFDGKCVIRPIEHVLLPTGMALYTAPPKREPLASEELRSVQEHQRLLEELGPVWAPMLYYFCRAIERAHGIGGEE